MNAISVERQEWIDRILRMTGPLPARTVPMDCLCAAWTCPKTGKPYAHHHLINNEEYR